MRPRTSHYPIGKLLLKTLEASGLSLYYFSLAIGYGNSYKGFRAFDQMLSWGVPNTVFLTRLQSSRYAIPAETLTEAIVQSETIVAEENRLARTRTEQIEDADYRDSKFLCLNSILNLHIQFALRSVITPH